ncbi:MAG: hypothetical protein ACI8Z1_000334 [Candidatus Azotimanducaceae bacterium]|jgi:hypothetical protein
MACSPGYAHLLNMTEAIAEIDPVGHLEISIELDLLTEYASAERYYAAAQSDATLASGTERFARLAAAVEVIQDDVKIHLRVTQVQWPSGYSLSDYQNQISWPKTKVQLQGRLNAASPITIRFAPTFIFEEPIALTIRATDTGKRKSRWLVAGQTSQRFDPGSISFERADLSLRETVNQAAIFIVYGFSHIIEGGWDHLLFLLALCLSTNRTLTLITRISVFTVAHTMTLAMASYKIIELSAYWVEIAIVGSIVLVAINNLWQQSRNNGRPKSHLLDTTVIWIFAFGLLHGMGFASSLQSLEATTDYFLINLLGFNLGVELAQICFILSIMGILTTLDHQGLGQVTRNRLSWMTTLIASVWLAWIVATT